MRRMCLDREREPSCVLSYHKQILQRRHLCRSALVSHCVAVMCHPSIKEEPDPPQGFPRQTVRCAVAIGVGSVGSPGCLRTLGKADSTPSSGRCYLLPSQHAFQLSSWHPFASQRVRNADSSARETGTVLATRFTVDCHGRPQSVNTTT